MAEGLVDRALSGVQVETPYPHAPLWLLEGVDVSQGLLALHKDVVKL